VASFPIWKARVRAWLQAETPPLLYVLDSRLSAQEEALRLQQAQATAVAAPASSASSVPASSRPTAAVKRSTKEERQLELDRQRVYNAIISALDDTHVGMIVTEVNEGDALGAWNILLRKYERNTAASRNQLRRELHTLRLGTSECVDEYKARALHIAARLRATKEVVSDGEVQYCLLEGLPAGYDVVRQALEVQDIVDLETTCIHLREVEDKLSRRSRDDEAERTDMRGPRASAAAVGRRLPQRQRGAAQLSALDWATGVANGVTPPAARWVGVHA
jgi:hypothetical protein